MNDLLAKDQLSIQDLQAFHQALDQEKQFDQDIFRNIAYLTGEIGELISEIRKSRKADSEISRLEAQEHIGEELVDCLAYVIKLANYAELDLHEAYVNKMKRNITREWHPKIR
jgi:NTP pyrophosphatase (non-canonical NTP hydrolase)